MAKVPEKSPRSPQQLEVDESDEIAQEIAKRISNLVPQKGQQAQVVAQVMSVVSEERFSGPIAHPRHLREYEDICPGAADRIIGMAEANLSHLQTMQSRALEGDLADGQSGRLYGFLALTMLIVAALISTYLGHEGIAIAFLGAGALGVVGQLINGGRRSRASKPADKK